MFVCVCACLCVLKRLCASCVCAREREERWGEMKLMNDVRLHIVDIPLPMREVSELLSDCCVNE